MSSIEDREKRQRRLKVKNSHHSSHKKTESSKKRMIPYDRSERHQMKTVLQKGEINEFG